MLHYTGCLGMDDRFNHAFARQSWVTLREPYFDLRAIRKAGSRKDAKDRKAP